MATHGFAPLSLFGTSQYFKDNSPDYISNGVSYNASQQMHALAEAQSAYFMALVVCQVFNLISSKTRLVSIFKHGMRNRVVNGAIVVAIGICVILIYIPDMIVVFGTVAVGGLYWLVPLPLAVCVLGWNELRKFISRRWPNSVLGKFLAW